MVASNPVDMTTLYAVKAWSSTPFNTSTSDLKLQTMITSLSLLFLKLTSRGARDWVPTQPNPFVQPVDYSEIYDGNGNSRLFLRNMPINSLSGISLGAASLPIASQFGAAGVSIDSSVNAIVIGGGMGLPRTGFTPTAYGRGGSRSGFPVGVQNIRVDYNAGFPRQVITGELQTIPASATPASANGPALAAGTILPQTILGGWNVLSFNSVAYFVGGTELTRVFAAPNAGEFYVNPDNTLLFNTADYGKQILLGYEAAGTPADIVTAMNQWVALNSAQSKPDRVGVRSLAMKDVGSTTYSTYLMDDSVKAVVSNYSRQSI